MIIYIWSFKCKKTMKVQNSWIAISNILPSLMNIFPTGDLKYTDTCGLNSLKIYLEFLKMLREISTFEVSLKQ